MSIVFSTKNILTYTITTPVFEGPLDLLLHLIEREELDITRLSLARVTDQYLNYLHNMDKKATGEISAFLVIAAKLLQIKSTALLPHLKTKLDIEEDVGDELVHQLIEYKKFKKVSEYLMQREENDQRAFLRLSPPLFIESAMDLSDVTIDDLMAIANEVFSRSNHDELLHSAISKTKITIRQKIDIIARALQASKKVGFWSLFQGNCTRIDIVVTFLALLELIKQNYVKAFQENPFDEIEIEKFEPWNLNDEIDLEFEE